MEVMPMNELYHHGIKGMHWGIRRFQNSDGTLTAAGRKRYSNNSVGGFFRKRSSKKDAKPKKTLEEIYGDDPAVNKHITWDKDGHIAKISKPLEKALDAPLDMFDDEEFVILCAMELGSTGKRNSSVKSDRQLRREAKRQRTWNAKNASQLSDKELTDQILRLQREKQLKDLTRQSVTPGKKHAHDLLQRYMDQALGAAVTTAVTVYATKKFGDKLNPGKSEYDKQYEQMRARMDAEKRIAREGGFSVRYDAQGKPINRGGNR